MVVLAGLPVAAYADPLDPTWAGGLWDDDDFDYVLLLVSNFTATMPIVAARVEPTTEAIGAVPLVRADVPFLDCRLPFHRRGPPRA
jgi:hypothetical protein